MLDPAKTTESDTQRNLFLSKTCTCIWCTGYKKDTRKGWEKGNVRNESMEESSEALFLKVNIRLLVTLSEARSRLKIIQNTINTD